MVVCGTMRFVTSMVVSRLAEYPRVVKALLSKRKRSERLAQDFTTDAVDDNVCTVAVCDTTHAVTQLLQGGIDDFIESERLRLLGFRMIGGA